MRDFIITIADLSIKLRFLNSDFNFIDLIYKRYKNFINIKKDLIANIDIYVVDGIPKINRFFTSKNIIVGDGFVFENNILFIRQNLYSFENFLRLFYSYELAIRDGFLIHSAGVYYKRDGFMFVGKSGSGKTTISHMLSNDFNIISDEVCAIRFIKKPFIYSTPFWGSFVKPLSKYLKCKLCKIFFPVKSNSLYLEDCSVVKSFKNILKCIFNFSLDKTVSDNLFLNVSKIVSITEINLLYFSKYEQDNFVSLIKSLSCEQKKS